MPGSIELTREFSQLGKGALYLAQVAERGVILGGSLAVVPGGIPTGVHASELGNRLSQGTDSGSACS